MRNPTQNTVYRGQDISTHWEQFVDLNLGQNTANQTTELFPQDSSLSKTSFFTEQVYKIVDTQTFLPPSQYNDVYFQEVRHLRGTVQIVSGSTQLATSCLPHLIY